MISRFIIGTESTPTLGKSVPFVKFHYSFFKEATTAVKKSSRSFVPAVLSAAKSICKNKIISSTIRRIKTPFAVPDLRIYLAIACSWLVCFKECIFQRNEKMKFKIFQATMVYPVLVPICADLKD